MPIASGVPPEAYVGMAAQPLDAMRPVLEAFWDTYAATRGFDEARRVTRARTLHALRCRPADLVRDRAAYLCFASGRPRHGAAAGQSQRAERSRASRQGAARCLIPSPTPRPACAKLLQPRSAVASSTRPSASPLEAARRSMSGPCSPSMGWTNIAPSGAASTDDELAKAIQAMLYDRCYARRTGEFSPAAYTAAAIPNSHGGSSRRMSAANGGTKDGPSISLAPMVGVRAQGRPRAHRRSRCVHLGRGHADCSRHRLARS